MREAARQMSRIRSGLDSDLRRERAARVFSLAVNGNESPKARTDDAEK